jgi:uncharacterized protein YecT (DUF1311 family)
MRQALLIGLAALIAAIHVASSQGAASAPTTGAAPLEPPPIHEHFTQLACPSRPVSTVDFEGCAEQVVLRTDKEIESLDSSIASFAASVPYNRLPRLFLAGHRAWLTYRERDCHAVSERFEGGSLSPLADLDCVLSRNHQRIKDLRAFRRQLKHP